MSKNNKNNENTALIDQIMSESEQKPVPEVESVPKYIKMHKDICKFLQISAKSWQKWRKQADFNVIETPEGWQTRGLLEYKLLKKHKDNRHQGVKISDGKAAKLSVETKILQAKYRRQIGQLIEFECHIDEMVELLEIVVQTMDYFVSEVVLLKNADMLKTAEYIRDKVILRLKSKIESARKLSPQESSSSSSESSSDSSSSSSPETSSILEL